MTRIAFSVLLVLLAPAFLDPAPSFWDSGPAIAGDARPPLPGRARPGGELESELCLELVSGQSGSTGDRPAWHEALVPGFRSPFEADPDSAESVSTGSAAGVPGTAGPRASARSDLDRARLLLLAGRHGEAWALLREADLSDSVEGSFLRAWAAYRTGAPEAGRLLAPLADLDLPLACRAPAARAGAAALAAAGDSAGSRRLLDALEADLPEIGDYLLLWRLQGLAATAGPEQVEQVHRALLTLEPSSALLRDADLARARTFERVGDGRRARSLLEDLVSRVPRRGRPELLLELARVEQGLGNAAAAAGRLREVATRYPASNEAGSLLDAVAGGEGPSMALSATQRATILAAHGRPRDAVAVLADASDPELLAKRAEIRLGSGDYAGAAMDYGAAIAQGGDPDRLGVEQAKAYGRGGEPARAREIYRRLLDGAPARPRAAELAYLIADTFQDGAAQTPALADSAAAWFRLLADRYPRAELARRGLLRLAQLRFARAQWAAADSLFREVLDKYPRSEDVRAARYWAARSALAAGRADEARELFAALLDATPPDYYGLLARRRMGGAGEAAAAALFAGGSATSGVIFRAEPADTLIPSGGPGSRALARARALLLVGESRAAQGEIDEAVRLSGGSREELLRVARWALARGYPESAFRVGSALLESGGDLRTARLAYPAAFPGYVRLESLETGLPAALLWAIMRQESSFDPAVRSPVEAAGLLQLMPATARAEVARLGLTGFEASDLDRPESNLHLGAAHLRELIQTLDGDRVAAIAAYNAGVALASRWRAFPEAADPEVFVERIPFRETRRYVKAVIANEARYQELYAAR